MNTQAHKTSIGGENNYVEHVMFRGKQFNIQCVGDDDSKTVLK